MHDIICPHCNKAFKIDQSGYADILKQVRNSEFEQELHVRLDSAEKEKISAIELAKVNIKNELMEINAAKDIEIQELKTKLSTGETNQQLEVIKAIQSIERERDTLANQLHQLKQDQVAASNVAEANLKTELQRTSSEKEAEIQQLKNQIDGMVAKQTIELHQVVGTIEKERDQLRNSLEKVEFEKRLSETSLKEKYEGEIKIRDEMIERLKDLKARLSTKMVGETLEQHCETEFNRLRATAFPRAYFEKDNNARNGSKGDFIFKDSDESETEFISIMFEMKNESDTTATKQKNESFFAELDRDRREKNCEYAVLVSLLEPDSELYNTGIVEVSHRFPKMYVIRPQFFIPIITLLRNAALNSLQYKAELALIKAQNFDVINFEDDLEKFKKSFAINYDRASTHFTTAISQIDKSIEHLQKTRDALLGTENNLRIANNKAQDITIRKLTNNNPTMKQMFKDLKNES